MKCTFARLVVCHCINVFYKCKHYHIVLCIATEKRKKGVIWNIKVFHSSFAFIKSIKRLIGLTHTHSNSRAFISNCVFYARQKSSNKRELCRFKLFTYVFATRDDWSTSLLCTRRLLACATPRALSEFTRISVCNQVLINSNAEFLLHRCFLIASHDLHCSTGKLTAVKRHCPHNNLVSLFISIATQNKPNEKYVSSFSHIFSRSHAHSMQWGAM